MELVFGMIGTTFEFFVDVGNKVDFLGLNLWEISFFVFVVGCVFRWLYPVVFAGEGASGASGISGVLGSGADSVNRYFERRASEKNVVKAKDVKRP